MLARRFCRYKRYARWFYDKPDKHDIEMPGMRGLKGLIVVTVDNTNFRYTTGGKGFSMKGRRCSFMKDRRG